MRSSRSHSWKRSHTACRQSGYGRGFTLMEVMLSIGILSFFLYAVYAAVQFQYRAQQACRTNVEQAQLLRELTRQMQSDLRATLTSYVPTRAAAQSALSTTDGSTSSSTSGTSSSSSSSSSSSIAPSEYNPPPGGIFGAADSVSLVVRTNLRQGDFLLAGDGSGWAPASDLRLIRYRMAGGYTMGSQIASRGLVREELPWIPDPQATADLAPVLRSEVIADEVDQIQISYFDGSSWYDYWTGQESLGPPLAIGITLAVRAVEPGVSADAVVPRQLHFVVPLVVPNFPGTPTSNGASTTASSSSSGAGAGGGGGGRGDSQRGGGGRGGDNGPRDTGGGRGGGGGGTGAGNGGGGFGGAGGGGGGGRGGGGR